MDWPAFLDETNAQLARLRPAMPEASAGFAQLAKAATASAALDPKTKELIALAIGIAAHCDGCIGFHTKSLVRLGTTRQEFEEMLGVAIYMGGGPSLMYAAQALDAWEQFDGA